MKDKTPTRDNNAAIARDNNIDPQSRVKKILKRTAIIMGSVIIVFSAVSMSIVIILYAVAFPRYERPRICAEYTYSDVMSEYSRETVFFSSRGNRLAGYIYGAENRRGLIVVAHGMARGADSYLAQIMYFVDRGWQVFAFDFTGSYSSGGDSVGGLSQGIYDMDAALDYIESEARFAGLPVLLFGHSWGGFSACAVSAYEKHNIAAIVAVSAFNSAQDVVFHFTQQYIHAYTYTQLPFFWAYEGIVFGDAAGLTAEQGIRAADVPVLLIHSEDDEVIPYELSVLAACELGEGGEQISGEIVRRTHTGLLYTPEAELLRGDINSSETEPNSENIASANEINADLMDKINNFFAKVTAK